MLMDDPVFAADGHTYERAELEAWLKLKRTSPKTGELLEHDKVTQNHSKRGEIIEFVEQHERRKAGAASSFDEDGFEVTGVVTAKEREERGRAAAVDVDAIDEDAEALAEIGIDLPKEDQPPPRAAPPPPPPQPAPPPPPPPAAAPVPVDGVNLYVRHESESLADRMNPFEIPAKMMTKSNTLSKVFRMFKANNKSVSSSTANSLTFTYKGRTLKEGETPMAVGIRDRDEIIAHEPKPPAAPPPAASSAAPSAAAAKRGAAPVEIDLLSDDSSSPPAKAAPKPKVPRKLPFGSTSTTAASSSSSSSPASRPKPPPPPPPAAQPPQQPPPNKRSLLDFCTRADALALLGGREQKLKDAQCLKDYDKLSRVEATRTSLGGVRLTGMCVGSEPGADYPVELELSRHHPHKVTKRSCECKYWKGNLFVREVGTKGLEVCCKHQIALLLAGMEMEGVTSDSASTSGAAASSSSAAAPAAAAPALLPPPPIPMPPTVRRRTTTQTRPMRMNRHPLPKASERPRQSMPIAITTPNSPSGSRSVVPPPNAQRLPPPPLPTTTRILAVSRCHHGR